MKLVGARNGSENTRTLKIFWTILGFFSLLLLSQSVYADDMFPGSPIVWILAFLVYYSVKALPLILPLFSIGYVLRYNQIFFVSILYSISKIIFFPIETGRSFGTTYGSFPFISVVWNVLVKILPLIFIILLIGSFFGRSNEKWKLDNKLSPYATVILGVILIWMIGFLERTIMWIMWKL